MDTFHTHATYQYISSNIVSMGTLICGLINGWSSSAVPILQSVADTPLKAGGITADELSWVASISNIGGCLGTFLFGYLADTFGRKKILCLISVPSFISFFIIVWADNVYELYISRFLGGLASGGSYIVAPIYIMEISDCSIRGYLTAKLQLFYNSGVFFAFVIGAFCTYQTTAIIYCVIPIVYGILTIILRETPFYLMKHDKGAEAIDNFRYFRRITEPEPFSSHVYQLELDSVKAVKTKPEVKFEFTLADFTNYPSVKAVSLGFVMAIMNQFSGVTALICYTESVFKESGSEFSPKISSLVIGIILIIGTATATGLIENAGRKKLMVSGSIGCGIVLIAFGISNLMQTYGYDVANIIPILCFGSHIFIASCGPLNLPYIIIPELLPHKIRSITLSFINGFIWILSFLCVKYFYIIAFTYGMYYCLFWFAVCLLIGSIFLVFLLPETKGKRFNEIQCALNLHK